MGVLLFVIGSLGSPLVWFFSIRPYVVAHGEGNKTGANMGVAMWVDWQSCGEIATKNGDERGRIIYRTFGVFQLVAALGFILIFIQECI
jgi:hypothetical protein